MALYPFKRIGPVDLRVLLYRGHIGVQFPDLRNLLPGLLVSARKEAVRIVILGLGARVRDSFLHDPLRTLSPFRLRVFRPLLPDGDRPEAPWRLAA